MFGQKFLTEMPRPFNDRKSFQQMGAEKTRYPHGKKKNEAGPLTLFTKINTKQIKDLNIRGKPTKLLKKMLGRFFYNIGFGNNFTNMKTRSH